jgi:hypothetical protein
MVRNRIIGGTTLKDKQQIWFRRIPDTADTFSCLSCGRNGYTRWRLSNIPHSARSATYAWCYLRLITFKTVQIAGPGESRSWSIWNLYYILMYSVWIVFALIFWELCSRYAKICTCGWNRWNQASSVNHGMSSIPGELWRKSWNRWQRRTGFCLSSCKNWLTAVTPYGRSFVTVCYLRCVSNDTYIQQYLHNTLLRWLGHLNKVLCIDCYRLLCICRRFAELAAMWRVQ